MADLFTEARKSTLLIRPMVFALVAGCQLLVTADTSAAENAQQPNPPTPDAVSITTDRHIYRPQDDIIATIQNGTAYPIVTVDRGYLCTIVDLERQAGADWQTLISCPSLQPPQERVIQPREHTRVAIRPRSFGELPEGVFRLSLRYRAVPTGSNTIRVYSAPFQVKRN